LNWICLLTQFNSVCILLVYLLPLLRQLRVHHLCLCFLFPFYACDQRRHLPLHLLPPPLPHLRHLHLLLRPEKRLKKRFKTIHFNRKELTSSSSSPYIPSSISTSPVKNKIASGIIAVRIE
jgi:hypothetical protein